MNDSQNSSSAFYANATLKALAPFKNKLWQFWSNCEQQQQQHQLQNKLSSATSISSMVTTRIGDSGASSGTAAIDSNCDFFSMPINIENFDKSVGAMRHNNYNRHNNHRDNSYNSVDIDSLDDGGSGVNDNGYEFNDTSSMMGVMKNIKTPAGGVFLQNSIWSSSGDYLDGTGAVTLIADTDESFLFKVWQSNKRLDREIDPENENNNADKMKSLIFKNEPNVNGSRNDIKFPSFTANLKWSEGINAPSCNNIKNGDKDNNINTATTTIASDGGAAVNDFGVDVICCTGNNCEMINCYNLRQVEHKCHSLDVIAAVAAPATTCTGANWHIHGNFGNLTANRPDLHSWSAADPTSLSEMYGDGDGVDGNGGLDVCDSIVSANSDDGDVTNANNSIENANYNVTLPNHCKVTSSFIAYSRIKQYNAQLQPVPTLQQQLQPSHLPPLHLTDQIANDLYDNENIEVGDIGGGINCADGTVDESGRGGGRSPFHPIELYQDGYSFQINNAFDVVEYERDTDGYLCLEADQYLTYKRDNIILSDVNTSTHSKNVTDNKAEFSVKFRVLRQCERASQTDDRDFKLASKIAKKVKTSLTHAQPSSSSSLRQQFGSAAFCDETIIKAINKAAVKSGAGALVSNAESIINQEQSTNLKDYRTWLPSDTIDEVDFSKKTSICSSKTNDIDIGIDNGRSNDEIQYLRNWSIKQINKNCRLNFCQSKTSGQCCDGNGKADTDESNCNKLCFDSSRGVDDINKHTLWGMCVSCNRCMDEQSLPANRLMRDELRLEGDEIMNELRYMQDLYIGNNDYNFNYDNEVDDDNDEIVEAGTDEDDNFQCHPMNYTVNNYIKKMSSSCSSSDIRTTNQLKNVIANNMEDVDCVQDAILKEVNRLIEDLLKPHDTSQTTCVPPTSLAINRNIKCNPLLNQERSSNTSSVQAIKKRNKCNNNGTTCNEMDKHEKTEWLIKQCWNEKATKAKLHYTTTGNNFWQYGNHSQENGNNIWQHHHHNSNIEQSENNKPMKLLWDSKRGHDGIATEIGFVDVDYETSGEEEHLVKSIWQNDVSQVWQWTPSPSPMVLSLLPASISSTMHDQDQNVIIPTVLSQTNNENVNNATTNANGSKIADKKSNYEQLRLRQTTSSALSYDNYDDDDYDYDNDDDDDNYGYDFDDNDNVNGDIQNVIEVQRKNLKNRRNRIIRTNSFQSIDTTPAVAAPAVAMAAAMHRRAKIKFMANRKRRHSALQNLQNFYHQQFNNRNFDDNNNNNNNNNTNNDNTNNNNTNNNNNNNNNCNSNSNNNEEVTISNNFKIIENIDSNDDHVVNDHVVNDHDMIVVQNCPENFILLSADSQQQEERRQQQREQQKGIQQQQQHKQQKTIVTCKYWASRCTNDIVPSMPLNEINSTAPAAAAATAMMILTAAAATATAATATAATANANANANLTTSGGGTFTVAANATGGNINHCFRPRETSVYYMDTINIDNDDVYVDNNNESNNVSDGNGFSRLIIDKGATATTTTILKQVAMLTRPLTR